MPRIFAHCPAISISRLEDELRERGAILVCDGVDRISALARPSVEASLRTILRDFPKAQIDCVVSRENAKPNLPIPTLRLKELTAAEQQEMRVLASAVSNCQEVMWNLPGVLQKLCSHPLLLNLIINHLIRHRSVPNGIGDLFESWLASVLPSQASGPASSIDREDALSLLAAETIDKPLTKSRAIALLVERGLPKLVFDELSSHDAIVVSGMTVEVQHESLADYMRARSIVSLPEVEMRTALRSVPLRTDSLFPILLMALLPSRSMQRLVWERLAVLDLSTYLDALRFHADVSSDIVGGSRDDAARSYLEDILDGIMHASLDAFFDDVRLPAMEALAHEKCNELAISGSVSAVPASLTYQLQAKAAEHGERVSVSTTGELIRGFSFVNLELAGLRLDSGRIVGAGRLLSALRAVLSARKLRGGCVFTNDLVAGRLRLLEERFGHNVDWETLASIEASLLPIANQDALPLRFRDQWQPFAITELIDDVRKLRQFGAHTVERWWMAHGDLDESLKTEHDEIRYLLNEHYRRLQLAYSEVASLSFGKLVHKLRIFPLLPVRWNLTVVRHMPTGRFTVFPRWTPVIKDWSAASCADVTFSERPPSFDYEAEMV